MFDEHEPAEFKIAADMSAVERQLARLTPAAPRIDRDRLMFEAGRAAERAASVPSPAPALRTKESSITAMLRIAGTRHQFWPAATAMMSAASVLLATMLVWQRQALQLAAQPGAPPIVATPAIDPPRAPQSSARPNYVATTWPALVQPSSGYLGVRYIALTRGVNAIEPSFSAANGGLDPSDDLQPSQRKMLNELLPSVRNESTPRS
jgi:hypothetical protein